MITFAEASSTDTKEKYTLNYPIDHGKIFEFTVRFSSGTHTCIFVPIFARFESLIESTRGDLYKLESGTDFYDVPAALDLYKTPDGTQVSNFTPDSILQMLVQITRLPTRTWTISYGVGEGWIQRVKKN